MGSSQIFIPRSSVHKASLSFSSSYERVDTLALIVLDDILDFQDFIDFMHFDDWEVFVFLL